MWGKFCAEFFSSLFLRLNIGISPVSTSSPDSTLPSQPGLCPQLPCWHCFSPGHQRLPCQTSRILLSPRLASLLAVWDVVNGPLCLKSCLGLSWVAPHSLDFLARSLPVSSEGFFSLKNDFFLTLQWSTSFSVVPVATSMLKTLYIPIFCLFPCVCLRPMCPIVCQAPAPADFMLECFLSSCVSCLRVFYHSPSGAWKPGQLPLLLLLTSRQSCVLCLVAQLHLTFCDPMDCSPPGSSIHGDSLGENTGVGCHALLQGFFPTQGSNPGLALQADSLLTEPSARHQLSRPVISGSLIPAHLSLSLLLPP